RPAIRSHRERSRVPAKDRTAQGIAPEAGDRDARGEEARCDRLSAPEAAGGPDRRVAGGAQRLSRLDHRLSGDHRTSRILFGWRARRRRTAWAALLRTDAAQARVCLRARNAEPPAASHGFSDALKADMLKARPNALMKALTGQPPAFRDSGAYDAATTLMLAAILAAQQNHLADPAEVTGAQIRDAMRAISDQHGEPVN